MERNAFSCTFILCPQNITVVIIRKALFTIRSIFGNGLYPSRISCICSSFVTVFIFRNISLFIYFFSYVSLCGANFRSNGIAIRNPIILNLTGGFSSSVLNNPRFINPVGTRSSGCFNFKSQRVLGFYFTALNISAPNNITICIKTIFGSSNFFRHVKQTGTIAGLFHRIVEKHILCFL